MATDSGWKRRDYLRVCSICGHRYHFAKLRYIGELKWACPDDYRGLTATQISRHNARARPLTVKAVKHPKPVASIDIYQLEEAQIFNFVTSVAPWNTRADKDNGAAKSTTSAARAGIYVSEILLENLRPATWLDTAASCLALCCTYLLTQQYGSPTGPAAADATGVLYGGILDGGVLASGTTALAGVAFLHSWAVSGNANHLQAAMHCATFLRHQQCAWQSSAGDQTQYNGGVYQLQGVAQGASTAGSISNQYNLSDNGAAIWFLTLLGQVLGTGTTFGEASSTYFTGITTASIATMISNCSTFLSVGAQDTTRGGAAITGLSATTPALHYLAQSPATPSVGFWQGAGASLTSVLTDQWALAMFGLNFAGLLTAQVTTVYNYLMSMTPNPANSPTGLSTATLLQGQKGVYKPTVAPAVSVETSTETAGTYYSWSAVAWLAPIQKSLNPAAFKTSKDALSKPRRVNAFDIDVRYMGPLSRSGLSFQVANLTADVATP